MRKNEFPISIRDTKYIVVTSSLFMVPFYYSIIYKKYLYSTTSLVTAIVSVNFWRDARLGWRRDTDLIVSKISFSIYFVGGLQYIKEPDFTVIGYPVCIAIIASYILSNYLWKKDSRNWKYAHVLFHIFIIIEQLFIILYEN